jgi:hypothetical protein
VTGLKRELRPGVIEHASGQRLFGDRRAKCDRRAAWGAIADAETAADQSAARPAADAFI